MYLRLIAFHSTSCHNLQISGQSLRVDNSAWSLVWSHSSLFQSSANLKCWTQNTNVNIQQLNKTSFCSSVDQVNSLILNWSLTNSVSGDRVRSHIVSSAWLLTPGRIWINAVSAPRHQFPDLALNWGKIVPGSLFNTGSFTIRYAQLAFFSTRTN